MPHTAFLEAAARYWSALGMPGSLPELSASPVDAFIDLLDVTADAEDAFVLLELDSDPYPGLALGDPRAPWRLHWAAQLASLEAFASPALPSVTFFVDTVADASGAHRVYTLDDGEWGDLQMASLASAVTWMAAQVAHGRGAIDDAEFERVEAQEVAALDDEREQGTASGWYLFEAFLDSPLVEAWDAYSRGQWPAPGPVDTWSPDDRGDGWQRRFALWLLHVFLNERRVELPADVAVTELDAPHRALVEHLQTFEEAVEGGEAPTFIRLYARCDDPKLAELATAWLQRHRRWRGEMTSVAPSVAPDDGGLEDALPAAANDGEGLAGLLAALAGKPEAPPEPEDTPFIRQLKLALDGAIDRLVQDDVLELEPDAKYPLINELAIAASDARSVKHMLRQLTRTLVDSKHVEEIYATDERIADALRDRLGDAR
ncbi:MAG: hypothetical protein KC543_14350 [Myxococcales bacterium]|nr:hypothetical protein [Myxococcales bacterium]